MLKNYFVTILRQIQKNKVFSAINILGLALGMAACLVIAQYVNFHSSFDTYHSKADRIYRIEGDAYKNGESLGNTINTPPMLGYSLKEQLPEVTSVARFFNYNYANNTIIYGADKDLVSFEQTGVYVTESDLFKVFDLPFIAGSARYFDRPQKAILTYSSSLKYFDDPQRAIGSTFTLSGNNGAHEYELVGVLEDLPDNSHLNFELLLSYPSLDNYTGKGSRESWTSNNMAIYLALDNSDAVSTVNNTIGQLYDENMKEAFSKAGYQVDYFINPLLDIHTNPESSGIFKASVDGKLILILSLIAFVILGIAWINYMNLSLIRTMERLKEMGIRKCMGSSLKQLTQLFVLEAFVMNVIAFGAAILMTQVGEKYIIEITELPISALLNTNILLLLSGLILVGTFLIGLYPNAILKTINIVNILVGQRGRVGGTKIRKSLVFVQFVITFVLIAGTLTIYKQINYMRDADLGIDIENILVIQSPPGNVSDSQREDVKRFNTLKTSLLNYPNIAQITNGGEIPGEPVGWGTNLYLKNKSRDTSVPVGLISMDLDFPDFFGIETIAGRDLRKGDNPWGNGEVLINEKLANQLGFANPEDAIGAELDGFYGPTIKVVGVTENHHHTSLHNDYQPLAYILSSWTEFYFIKLQLDENSTQAKGEQLTNLVNLINDEWDAVFTDYQMDYFFLDRAFDEQYKEDIRFGKIFSAFSSLAILIACLGLFGLTSFTIQQRTKEIGIRKVLGASAQNLVALLSKEYVLLIAIACVVSIPAAWYMMSSWLESYTFRIELGWWFYLLPVVFVVSLALISIITKIIGTIRTNPIESLRYE